MATSSFANIKSLRFVVTLTGQRTPFSVNGQTYNTITLEGLRAFVYIDNAGGAMMGTLKVQIFGVTASDMNTLTSPQWDIYASGPNAVQVFAVDGTQSTLVYNGQILNCWGDYSAMPETNLYMEAQVGYANLVESATPISISANTDVATVMGQIAQAMGFQFDNQANVQGSVAKGAYFANTLMEQARQLARDYNFSMYLESTNPNTLAITPNRVPRPVAAPLISPETGMIGYPVFNSTGVNFETLFNPAIVFGGPIQMQSSIPKANGTWLVTSMSHRLSSQMPGGPWQSVISAVLPLGGS